MNRLKHIGFLFIVCCFAACGTIVEVVEEEKKSAKEDLVEMTNRNNFGRNQPPDLENDGLFAVINTDKGDIKIKLEYEKAPVTVANFVALAEGNMENTKRDFGVPYFDGLTFHSVMSISNGDSLNFMIQSGCPDGVGNGHPGYSFQDEFNDDLKHDRPGAVSMANNGPDTNGSQFFITILPYPHLDNKHTVFGYTVSGQKVVMQYIKKNDVINSVVIERVGEAANEFDAVEVFKEKAIKVPRQ